MHTRRTIKTAKKPILNLQSLARLDATSKLLPQAHIAREINFSWGGNIGNTPRG